MNAKKLIELFPNLGKGWENGLSLRAQAEKIRDFKGKSYFSRYGVESIVKFLQVAYLGGSFQAEELEGLLGEDRYKELYAQKVRKGEGLQRLKEILGYDNWSDVEKNFVLELYAKSKGPKEIYLQYLKQESFNERSYDAISSFLDIQKKQGVISRQRIDWEGDVGFFAWELLCRYGREGNYLLENARSLDEYFFEGRGVLDKSKLHNFYRRGSKRSLDEKLYKIAA